MIEPPTEEEAAALDAELAARERAFRRTPTWRKVERYLTERKGQLEMECGRTGLLCCDRALLQGKIAMISEACLQLPGAMVQDALAAELASTPEDELVEGPRRPSQQRPDLL